MEFVEVGDAHIARRSAFTLSHPFFFTLAAGCAGGATPPQNLRFEFAGNQTPFLNFPPFLHRQRGFYFARESSNTPRFPPVGNDDREEGLQVLYCTYRGWAARGAPVSRLGRPPVPPPRQRHAQIRSPSCASRALY
ncbi:MAG: hypothetical protein BJ554DRAFT_7219 [Olpidium bornovanus]|uniref:Uncharacterized protein n=1 Tax=Olpidium bornovanus TaxID=278681 RepID=A0A8H7ZWH9_9FUNG|nr:MAG: hypothetical protein BJ554DRAFT_7219 [Olpidium bornovanus]